MRTWEMLRPWAVAFVLATMPCVALAQEINELSPLPSPACVGDPVAVRLHGVGPCSDIVVDFDDGTMSVSVGGALPLQVPKPSPYQTPGTYELTVTSSDCGVNLPGGFTPLEVNSCNRPEAGLHQETTIGPIIEMTYWEESGFSYLRPQVHRFCCTIQPGGPSFFLFGAGLPLKGQEAAAPAFLAMASGLISLTVEEWSLDGTWGRLNVPDESWITGVGDHFGLLWVQTVEGIQSHQVAVPFTAAREVKLLPPEDIELVACGFDSNADCCTGGGDPDDGATIPFTGEFIPIGCPRNADFTYMGSHANDWGAVGNDEGTDTYRISLQNGWEIEQISFEATPSEVGQAVAFQTTLASPAEHSTWDESIEWEVTPNDDISYRGKVFISGPRGTSHK